MHVIVTCTLRTMEEQAALYAQGREEIAAVNALRRVAGMPPIKANANRIVTCARPGQSMHNFGLAFDVVPLDGGKPVWNVSDPVWQRVGRTGKACGLEWAGEWKRFREYAHFQYTGGLSLAEIREGTGNRPGSGMKSLAVATSHGPRQFLSKSSHPLSALIGTGSG